MRRIALLGLALTLSGCGYKTWSNLPFSGGDNPNLPTGDSENMRRVQGQASTVPQLTTEPGDIWPGPLQPAPTLKDLVGQGGLTSQPEMAVPGSPLNRGTAAPSPSTNPAVGSSTPPGGNQPGLSTPPTAPPVAANAPLPLGAASSGRAGQVVQTPSGPTVTTGGGPGYQTTVTPGGGQSIIVPNGNGTSTVIHSDGKIETIPSPK